MAGVVKSADAACPLWLGFLGVFRRVSTQYLAPEGTVAGQKSTLVSHLAQAGGSVARTGHVTGKVAVRLQGLTR
jgi:hypothetical protein